MKLSVNFGVGAIFKCVVRKADTHEVVKETPEFHNLVLDSGLDRMSVGTWIDRCVVGSGNSEPTATQVSLDAFIASTTTLAAGVTDSGAIQVTTPPYYWCGRRTWRFSTGTATGNLSEIGLGWGNSNLWNRALIRDNSGNPTTITVLSDEYLDVFCEVRVYPSESSGSFNIVDKLGNILSSHTFTSKAVFFQNSSGYGANFKAGAVGFGSVGAASNGFHISSNIMPIEPTISISEFFKKKPVSQAGVRTAKLEVSIASNEANAEHRSFQAGIRDLMCISDFQQPLPNSCAIKWEISPPIIKTNSMILTYSATLSWGRYEPT